MKKNRIKNIRNANLLAEERYLIMKGFINEEIYFGKGNELFLDILKKNVNALTVNIGKDSKTFKVVGYPGVKFENGVLAIYLTLDTQGYSKEQDFKVMTDGNDVKLLDRYGKATGFNISPNQESWFRAAFNQVQDK